MKRLADMTNDEQQALMLDMTTVLARVDPVDRVNALFGMMVRDRKAAGPAARREGGAAPTAPQEDRGYEVAMTMSDDQRIPESERLEAVARRLLADFLGHGRRWGRGWNSVAHRCFGFDNRARCNECGRDGNRAPDIVTLFVGTLGQWWVNGTAGGRPVEYVPASLVLPVLRAFLAQSAELHKLRADRDRDDYRWLAAQDRAVSMAVEDALLGPVKNDREAAAPGDLHSVRVVADAVWAVAKGLDVSDAARRLKGLASRLHELESERSKGHP
jgi:hypothetical protein